MQTLPFLHQTPITSAQLKTEFADFIVKEDLGYPITGEGEFVAIKVRKTDCNTLFVGEQLAKFAGLRTKDMSYAGLKDRKAITEQWFCLHMPGKTTPDFSQFLLDGVEILDVTRHNRKIRIGSLQGNFFAILLRGAQETDDLKVRLDKVAKMGFPNYFTEQRFGHDGNNLNQAIRWAAGEIQVKDRKKRSFYLSAARSEIFNLVVAARIEHGLIEQVLPQDILQLSGSHSWFIADENQDLAELQQRLMQNDILLTAPLIGKNGPVGGSLEQQILADHQALLKLMTQENLAAARRPMLMRAKQFNWQFEQDGLLVRFWLPAGVYATALIRELVKVNE